MNIKHLDSTDKYRIGLRFIKEEARQYFNIFRLSMIKYHDSPRDRIRDNGLQHKFNAFLEQLDNETDLSSKTTRELWLYANIRLYANINMHGINDGYLFSTTKFSLPLISIKLPTNVIIEKIELHLSDNIHKLVINGLEFDLFTKVKTNFFATKCFTNDTIDIEKPNDMEFSVCSGNVSYFPEIIIEKDKKNESTRTTKE